MTEARISLVGRYAALAALLAACGGSGFAEPQTLGGKVVAAETLNRGQNLFLRYCATCHGVDGKAETSQARALEPRPRDFAAAHFKYKAAEGDALPTDAELAKTIRHGIPGTGMPAWPNLDDADLDAVVQYVKTFSPRWRSEKSSAIDSVHRAIAGRAEKGEDNGSEPGKLALPAKNDTVSFRAAFGASR